MRRPSRLASIAGLFATLGAMTALVLAAPPGAPPSGAPPRVASRPDTADSKAGAAKGKPRTTLDHKRILTLIEIELVTGDEGVGLRAQRWSTLFDKLDVTLTIRRAGAKDKPGVTEKRTGESVRRVHIVGRLDKDGRIDFGDRIYSENDSDKIARWLDELREFGALGTSEGRPAWGLTKEQFGALHETLSQPLTSDLSDQEFTSALKLFGLPEQHPIRLSESAAEKLKALDESKVVQSLKGLSRGTALAAMLAEWEFGFRPRRRQDGTIELLVAPLSEVRDAWPVGWPRTQSGPSLAPRLFQFTQVDLSEIELDAVLAAAADIIDIPIVVDRGGLAAKEIDLSQVKVSYPAKRTTWSQALQRLLFQAKAKEELLVDEAGRPFLWVSHVTVPRRPQKD